MNICFPARKKNGKNYDSTDEMMSLIRREPHGTWLAGTNMLWHGGIHLSEVSAPGSVMTGNADAAVPLQCMAEGEVVAWRLNRDYLTSEYNKQTLQYSSTFVLVKSLCKPDPDKENSWLEFYSLYIGLAPLCDFPALTVYQVTEKGNGIRARHYTGQENGGQAAPGVTGQSLKIGTQVVILRQESFQLKGQSEPFGLAQLLNAGKAHGDKFWVSLREEYLNAQGQQYGNLPEWMHHAVAQGTFDAVVKPAQKLTIAAGEAVGFLAKDIDPLGKGLVDTSVFAHVEVLSTDARMPGFLNNPCGVTAGTDFIRIPSGKTLYSRHAGEGKDSTFTAMSAVVVRDGGKILPVDKCHPYTDSAGKIWYEISPHSWMCGDDVDRLHQYDLKERGFTALEEGVTTDMGASLREGWMMSAFGHLSEQVNPDRGIQQQQVSEYYKKALKNIDTDGNGHLSGEELFRAMHHPEMGVQDIVARMVVKHDSEWFGDSCQTKWAPYFKHYDRLRLGYAMKWRDDMAWMSRVAPFSEGSPVWHMHPVMFLDAIGSDDMDIKWLTVSKGQLTFDAEGNDDDKSPWFSRHVHWPGGVSGVTIGRGYDLGQQHSSASDLNSVGIGEPLKTWLIEAQGMSGSDAQSRYSSRNDDVKKYDITRKQQYDLFVITYNSLEADVKRICQKPDTIKAYHPTPNIPPEQAWEDIPDKIKEVLIDLRYRGDYTPHARSILQRFAYSGDVVSFGRELSNSALWPNVPRDRFLRRVNFYES